MFFIGFNLVEIEYFWEIISVLTETLETNLAEGEYFGTIGFHRNIAESEILGTSLAERPNFGNENLIFPLKFWLIFVYQ